ncbi:Formate dehydrogenase H [Fundidesulfovibrio magnetotacticus]|uniref:Formate dehydrogenase H n=1 Tax=Fundidesulfovibrio magnetotacticus TaxID=2730080 RepID=A0A6V8LWF6_9BACT|nr:molybdopterin-dependent oxidoreductase [Fundidesulfovibrio magnetotacticus]GFK94608.1 Formate dehydrogenase H [Fundidesulfovibrio magnetotacticus]
MSVTRTVTTCTRDCPSCCGLVAVARDGVLQAIEGNPAHPLNRGGRCRKMRAYVARVNSPERVLHPMRREGVSWRRVSWAQALDELADRLGEAASSSGPESILHYQGYGERTALKLLNGRFFAHLGGATGLAGSLCSGTAYAAMALDFGTRLSHDPLDHQNSRTLVLWGRNPAATQFNMARILARARKNGATVWLVDPAATESLALAHRHVRPAPGADLHLALAAARHALEQGWEDKDFLRGRSEGFEAFRALAFARPVEEHARLAGVPPEDARGLAHALCRERPAAVLLGWGLHRHVDAHLGVRAIDALQALAGNVGVPGGGVSQGFEEYGPYDQSVWGEHLHLPRRAVLLPDLARSMEACRSPRLRAAVVSAANPACMAPDSEAVARAFRALEFTAYMGHFLDDTARLAHLFLPCATFLEEDDVVASYGHNYLGPVNRACAPRGECRSQFAVYQDLAARFPFAKDYVKPLDDWLSIICRPFLDKGFTLEDIRRGPVRDPDAPMVPWREGPFDTPSGRFRFLDALEFGPEASDGRPLTLLTTGSPEHLCSELTPAEHDPLPVARVHPDAGRSQGVADGEPAWMESDLGRVKVLVSFDAAQRPDVCLCRRGGWIAAGHGLNRLIPAGASALGNGTPYYRARVSLRPAVPVDSAGHGQ